jgi:hypothetical protein
MLDTTDLHAKKRGPKGSSKSAKNPTASPPAAAKDGMGLAGSERLRETSSEAQNRPISPITSTLPKNGRQGQPSATSPKETSFRAPPPRGPNESDAPGIETCPRETDPGLKEASFQAPPSDGLNGSDAPATKTGARETDPGLKDKQVNAIRRGLLPSTMVDLFGTNSCLGDVKAWRKYLDDVMRDAGDPTDPVEIMLLEQVTLLHTRAIQLQTNAAQATGSASCELYTRAAVRLVTEMRKIAIALRTSGTRG